MRERDVRRVHEVFQQKVETVRQFARVVRRACVDPVPQVRGILHFGMQRRRPIFAGDRRRQEDEQQVAGGVDGQRRRIAADGPAPVELRERRQSAVRVERPAVVGTLDAPRDGVDPALRQRRQAVGTGVDQRAPLSGRRLRPRRGTPLVRPRPRPSLGRRFVPNCQIDAANSYPHGR